MSSAAAGRRGRMRFSGVRAPKPRLGPESEQRLSARQLEILDELESDVRGEELARLTMAEIAARLSCSLRTLYGIAPSKDELILTIVDRRLHRIGRAAMDSLDESMTPLRALRTYLAATNAAVQPESVALSEALGHVPGAQHLLDAHERYVMAVTRSLLERARDAGEIREVDTAAVAHVLGGLGRSFDRRGTEGLASGSPRAAADAMADVILRGLAATLG